MLTRFIWNLINIRSQTAEHPASGSTGISKRWVHQVVRHSHHLDFYYIPPLLPFPQLVWLSFMLHGKCSPTFSRLLTHFMLFMHNSSSFFSLSLFHFGCTIPASCRTSFHPADRLQQAWIRTGCVYFFSPWKYVFIPSGGFRCNQRVLWWQRCGTVHTDRQKVGFARLDKIG